MTLWTVKWENALYCKHTVSFSHIKGSKERCLLDEPVWPSGKQRDLGSNPLRLSFLFESCGPWTLSCDFVPHN